MIVLFLPGGPYRGRMPKAFRKQRSTGDLPVTTYAGTGRSPKLFPMCSTENWWTVPGSNAKGISQTTLNR